MLSGKTPRERRHGLKPSGETETHECGLALTCNNMPVTLLIDLSAAVVYREHPGEKRGSVGGEIFRKEGANLRYPKCGSKRWLVRRKSPSSAILGVKTIEKIGNESEMPCDKEK